MLSNIPMRVGMNFSRINPCVWVGLSCSWCISVAMNVYKNVGVVSMLCVLVLWVYVCECIIM